jgi:nicotinic acid phosphoribosyltransferase
MLWVYIKFPISERQLRNNLLRHQVDTWRHRRGPIWVTALFWRQDRRARMPKNTPFWTLFLLSSIILISTNHRPSIQISVKLCAIAPYHWSIMSFGSRNPHTVDVQAVHLPSTDLVAGSSWIQTEAVKFGP